ncbi:hypothetical protein NDU88_002596 [Pleurodeles waltl]|uniref:Uncharacterized protein n=1 Tax=Pleurodeles waltl TaxID=8319 RepID=A0AAV7M2N9_PLEWA|nr:hypothetical protein NDU88_002596 [Pleurodeles waltl]
MAAAQYSKDKSVEDLLPKPTTGKAKTVAPAMERHERNKEGEDPIMQAFLERLFTLLREDLKAVKGALSQDLKEVQHKLEKVSERVAILEEHENSQVEEIVQLQLREKQIRVRDSPEITLAIFGCEEYAIALYLDDVVVALDDPLRANSEGGGSFWRGVGFPDKPLEISGT